ncbi:hypothetical protein TIFTF001_038380 [Ficus carica]|uniref:Uncharacterized protein n=1 Tax=Ficus carica TaxID=3494 RepID=A0AA88EIG3_FICCA|nr:hypothetical protein TIFTF001_038380 [Ficus carica]
MFTTCLVSESVQAMTKIAAGAISGGTRAVMGLRRKIEEGGFESATSGGRERDRESMVRGEREKGMVLGLGV